MSTIGHKLREAYTQLNDAALMARVVFAAFSGGNDSVVAGDILYRWCRAEGAPFRVMSIDTGLSADSWKEDVVAFCEKVWGTTPEFYTGDGFDGFRENVLKYGFGYTPNQHAVYYRMLKQRAIEDCTRQNKLYWKDRVVYVTGVRREESIKRAETPYYHRKGARVTLNIICEFTKEEVNRYIRALLPQHVSRRRSHDCHCNWTCSETVGTLRTHSPVLAHKISLLEQEVVDQGLWKYGEKPTKEQIYAIRNIDTETMPPDSLCISCVR